MSTSALTSRSADRLIAELFQIVDGRRWDELGSVFADGCEYRRPGYDPIVGLVQIEHFYRHVRIIEVGTHIVDYTVSDLGVAACWGRFRGYSRDGRELDESFADTYRVRDGRIVYRRTYFYRAAI